MKYLNNITNLPDNSCMVDDEDLERLSKFKYKFGGNGGGGVHRGILRNHKYTHVSLAQDIMRRYDSMFDHADRNSLNSQKENLRPCSWSQNNANKIKQKGNYHSKYKGVTWHKRTKLWHAYISVNRNRIYLGAFVSEEDAAHAYDKAAIEFFKEFACLNFK